MPHNSAPPSSNRSRKHTFDEFIQNQLAPDRTFDAPDPDGLTPSDAISWYFQFAYQEQLSYDRGSMRCILDPSKTPLEKLQGASQSSSDFHDCMPFEAKNPMWLLFTNNVAEAMVDLVKSPGTFHESLHVNNGTVKISAPDQPWEAGPNLTQTYYTRVMDVESTGHYVDMLELTGKEYPEDLPFIVLQLQYLGFGSRGSSLLKNVMQQLGYQDVTMDLDTSVEGIYPNSRPCYSGSTTRSPNIREDEDRTLSDSTSRMRNFTQLHKEIKWRIFIWTPLQQAIEDKLEWRTRKELGQVEAVLVDCIVPNFNKARGGWIHSIKLHPTVSVPLETMLGMLPDPRPVDPTPPALRDDLMEMIGLEESFFRSLQNSHKFGNLFGPTAIQHLEREFVDAIRCIKGAVSSITLTKDLPQEAGRGLIDTSLDGGQVGRAMAIYQAMMTAIHDLESGGEAKAYEVLRRLDGAFIDLWHFFELHKWWGLLVLLVGMLFRRARPYAIHSWSAVIGGIFSSNLLYTLPRDLAIDSLQGPEAVMALTPETLKHIVIQQSYHVPQDRKFREKQGTLKTVRIGPGILDYANHLSKGDPGDLFYRQIFFVHDKRRHTLLNGLSVALNRLTEEHLATQVHPTTEMGKIQFLKEIREKFDRVAAESGVRKVLEEELRRQRICDKAQGALLAKSVGKEQVGGVGDDDSIDEDGNEAEVRKETKRRKIGKKASHPRHKGLLALGDPHSNERRRQLEGLQHDARAAINLGQAPAVVWFDGMTATSPQFAKVFQALKKNHSLQLALNAHGRTPAGIQGHKENGRRLAELNKTWAVASREAKTKLMGGWIRAEQFDQLKTLIPLLREDMTEQDFEQSHRAAKCPKKECRQRVLSKGKNPAHRCTEKMKAVPVIKTKFDSYLRLLHFQDVFTLTDIDLDVRTLAADEFGLNDSPALDWVLNEDGFLLPNFPFPLDPDHVDCIKGMVWWDKNKPKMDPHHLLMAADVVLRDLCPGDTPLDVAENGGETIFEGAHLLCNSNQDKYWKPDYMVRVVDAVQRSSGVLDACICLRCGDIKIEYGKEPIDMMIHAPCTRGKNALGKSEEDFYWFSPRKLTDLPHAVARILLYRAVNGANVEGNEDWGRLLEWSG